MLAVRNGEPELEFPYPRGFHTMCPAGLQRMFLSSLLSSLTLRPQKEHENLLALAHAALSVPRVSALTQMYMQQLH